MKKFFVRLSQPSKGLLLQLLLVIVLPLTALLIIITFGSISIHQKAMRSLVGERDERAVRTAAASISSQISNRTGEMRSLALRGASDSPAALSDVLASSGYLLADFDYGLAFFSRDGTIIAAAGDQAFWKELSSGPASPLPALLEDVSSQVALSKEFLFPDPSKPVVYTAAGVPGEGPGSNFVAIGAYSPQGLVQKTLGEAFLPDATSPGNQTTVLMMDAGHHVIYLNGAQDFGPDPASHPGIPEALRGETGTAFVQTSNDEHVVAYTPVSSMGWALVTEESWETVANPTLQTSQVAPLVLIPALLIVLAALWFGVRQVIQPLQKLEDKAAQVAWGDYQAIEKPVGGIAEIRHLQAELVHLVLKVQAAQQSLHSYIGAITAGQEEERARLARDLHDDTIQSLIALKQRVQLAQLSLEKDAGREETTVARSLRELETLTEKAIENLRRVTQALRPIYLEDLGLVAALEMLAREKGQAMKITIQFTSQGIEKRLPPAIELALYRIAQEALNNIEQHAQASQASLGITFSTTEVKLNILDNGKGFVVPKSPAEFAPSGHYGLLGLHERAELIGAAIKIQSSPGQGTRLVVTLTSLPSS